MCKELGFDMVEFNASDTRSKTLIKEQISELLNTTSLSAYSKGMSTLIVLLDLWKLRSTPSLPNPLLFLSDFQPKVQYFKVRKQYVVSKSNELFLSAYKRMLSFFS